MVYSKRDVDQSKSIMSGRLLIIFLIYPVSSYIYGLNIYSN